MQICSVCMLTAWRLAKALTLPAPQQFIYYSFSISGEHWCRQNEYNYFWFWSCECVSLIFIHILIKCFLYISVFFTLPHSSVFPKSPNGLSNLFFTNAGSFLWTHFLPALLFHACVYPAYS